MSPCKDDSKILNACIVLVFLSSSSANAIRCEGILLFGAKECPPTTVTTTPHHTNSASGQSKSTTTPRLTAPSAGRPVNGNSSGATSEVTSAPEYSPKGTQKDYESVLIKVLPPALGVVVTGIVFTTIIIIYFKKQTYNQRTPVNDEEERIKV